MKDGKFETSLTNINKLTTVIAAIDDYLTWNEADLKATKGEEWAATFERYTDAQAALLEIQQCSLGASEQIMLVFGGLKWLKDTLATGLAKMEPIATEQK